MLTFSHKTIRHYSHFCETKSKEQDCHTKGLKEHYKYYAKMTNILSYIYGPCQISNTLSYGARISSKLSNFSSIYKYLS
jgi:hypothetical protein